MKQRNSSLSKFVWLLFGSLVFVLVGNGVLLAQGPTVDQAMKIKPRQPGVDCDMPNQGELSACRIEKSSRRFSQPGYVVYDGAGRILRQFFDTNKDGSLDQWSYFKDGVEIYRDIDSNYDKRTDQYRWLGTAGTRWGIDQDQDGAIDQWKMISAEEVAEEVFKSVQNRDVARFQLLLPDADQLKELQLGAAMNDALAGSLKTLPSRFKKLSGEQKWITSRSNWVHFGSSRPSLIPQGQSGIERDLIVYDHASAVFQTGEQFGQLSLGTIMRLGDTWRITELPQIVEENSIVRNGGFFYPNDASPGMLASAGQAPDTEKMSQLFGQYDQLEQKLTAAQTKGEINELEKERAEILLRLALNSKGEDQTNWIRQMADTLSGAFQADRFDSGLDVLAENVTRLKQSDAEMVVDYPRWRIINARFSKAIQQGNSSERNDANDAYISDLESFVVQFPDSQFSAEAMLQLALYAEVSGQDGPAKATDWYRQIQQKFSGTMAGQRAAGAVTRLTSQGKPIAFKGQDLKGRQYDLKSSRGKIVVIHYWETWCDACIDNFDELEKLNSKYRSKLNIVGANLDTDKEKLTKFLAQNQTLSWPQLNAPGGVEKSPLAVQLGVTTLPMTLLIDQRGNLVESNVPIEELDREIQRLIRQAGVAAGPQQKIRN